MYKGIRVIPKPLHTREIAAPWMRSHKKRKNGEKTIFLRIIVHETDPILFGSLCFMIAETHIKFQPNPISSRSAVSEEKWNKQTNRHRELWNIRYYSEVVYINDFFVRSVIWKVTLGLKIIKEEYPDFNGTN